MTNETFGHEEEPGSSSDWIQEKLDRLAPQAISPANAARRKLETRTSQKDTRRKFTQPQYRRAGAALVVVAALAVALTFPQVQAIEVEGTQRIEPDVIFLRIRTKQGSSRSRWVIREDIRAIMSSGYFRRVVVESVPVPGGVKIIYHVEERPTIRSIRYDGVKELEEEDLQEVVTLKPNTFLNIGTLKENVEKIRKLYANEGYYRANVNYEAETLDNNQVNVVFRIQENEEIKVRKVLFLGNTKFTDKQLRKILQTKKKSMLSFITSAGAYKEDLLHDDVIRLTLWYLDHGYLQFTAKPPVTMTTEKGMYVFFTVEEGEQYTVRSMRWENATEEEEAVLGLVEPIHAGLVGLALFRRPSFERKRRLSRGTERTASDDWGDARRGIEECEGRERDGLRVCAAAHLPC